MIKQHCIILDLLKRVQKDLNGRPLEGALSDWEELVGRVSNLTGNENKTL